MRYLDHSVHIQVAIDRIESEVTKLAEWMERRKSTFVNDMDLSMTEHHWLRIEDLLGAVSMTLQVASLIAQDMEDSANSLN
jgi:hypothetical protein